MFCDNFVGDVDGRGSVSETSAKHKHRPALFLEPVFKQRVWGGSRLGTDFPYEIPGDDIGECWAVSAYPGGDCMIADGYYKGKRLSELWEEAPWLFGNSKFDRFPLLVKILDAKEDLSVQVHPDDTYAALHEKDSWGKAECWYILDCPEDASMIIGHNAKTKEELTGLIQQGKWSELIREVPVKKGDFIQNAPGTIHAIKGGILLLEVQQSSDITYRVYDYDRKSQGKARELHIQQSIDVITVPAVATEDILKPAANLPNNVWNELIACDYYTVWKLEVAEPFSFIQNQPFMIVSVIDGEGLMNGQMIKKGDHFILPDGYGQVDMQGEMVLIASTAK